MARKIGITFSEKMAGTYCPRGGGGESYGLTLHIDASTSDLWQALRSGKVAATGHVEAEGLAERAPMQGFMVIKPLLARYIRYEFDFVADDGARYHYTGQKDIRHTRPVQTWTTLPGALYDSEGNKVADSVLYFDFKTLIPFLRSFTPTLQSSRSPVA